jgi:hypothetical protein
MSMCLYIFKITLFVIMWNVGWMVIKRPWIVTLKMRGSIIFVDTLFIP